MIENYPPSVEPRDLAKRMIAEIGITAAANLCDRELFLTNHGSSPMSRLYWKEVRAELQVLADKVLPEPDAPAIVATPEEGVRLVNIFSRIADPRRRSAVLQLAIAHFREDTENPGL